MLELLWLLLPVAAASGWYAAKRASRKKTSDYGSALSSDYIKGLNYLLNEQPDKALEIFIQMVEVDTETVETHLVLGSIFRRRGEVDRAIRIHQNLIARPNLAPEHKIDALLELGKDYMKAGLLDRAEGLFQELISFGSLQAEVYQYLREIYEQEKEWDKAIEAAVSLQQATGHSQSAIIAHYHCEIGEAAFRRHETFKAAQEAKRALAHDKNSVRASILLGDIAIDKGDHRLAIKNYTRVISQDPDALSVIIPKVRAAYRKGSNIKGFVQFLQKIKHRQQSVQSFLALIDALLEQGQTEEAERLITQEITARETASINVVGEYARIKSKTADGDDAQVLERVAQALSAVAGEPGAFLCAQCGYQSKGLLWQCPSCHGWGKMKSMDRLESPGVPEPSPTSIV